MSICLTIDLDPLHSKHVVSMQECGLHHRRVRVDPTWAFISHPSPVEFISTAHMGKTMCVCFLHHACIHDTANIMVIFRSTLQTVTTLMCSVRCANSMCIWTLTRRLPVQRGLNCVFTVSRMWQFNKFRYVYVHIYGGTRPDQHGRPCLSW